MNIDAILTSAAGVAVGIAVVLVVQQELVHERSPATTRVRSTATSVAVVVAIVLLGLRLASLVA